jgi:hypothetical protein
VRGDQLRTDAEIAGLETYKLIAVAPWPRPEICDLRDADLYWSGARTIKTGLGRTEDLSLRFAELSLGEATGRAARVHRFATRFGPLRLCEHRLPMTHMSAPAYRYVLEALPSDVTADLASGLPPESYDDPYLPTAIPGYSYAEAHLLGDSHSVDMPRSAWRESLDDWLLWAQGAAVLIRFISSCHETPTPKQEHWGELAAWLAAFPHEFSPSFVPISDDHHSPPQLSASWTRHVTGEILGAWMRWGNVQLRTRWRDDKPFLELKSDSLFGAIAVDLVRMSLGGGYVEFCTNCLQPFRPKVRRTQRGKDPYCSKPECRKAISRNSKKRLRHQNERSA